jgi:hypothetical protein
MKGELRWRGQIVFQFLTTIILRRVLSIVHEITGGRGGGGGLDNLLMSLWCGITHTGWYR